MKGQTATKMNHLAAFCARLFLSAIMNARICEVNVMKKFIVDKMCSFITNNLPNEISDDRYAMIRYGAEALYIGVSKSIIIILVACFMGCLSDVILCMVAFGLIRSVSFGLHAFRGLVCTVLSVLVMIGIPMVSRIIYMSLWMKVVCCLILIMLFALYSPSDTKKRPLVNPHVRKRLKVISVAVCIAYSLIAVISISVYSYMLILSLAAEAVLILPISYRMFSESRDNYKNYDRREGLS